jgi:transcription elongation factor Elf1
MPLSISQRLQYLKCAATTWLLDRDRQCPACNSSDICLVRRKYLVTSLWECEFCGLRFRMPRDHGLDTVEFYQDEYSEGFTTDCPSEVILSTLIERKFVGSEKDFSAYIGVLKSLGMEDGDSLLDFGASWGYGSWQFRRAGFRVFSYEISKPRAAFARAKLSCDMVESMDKMPEKVKCLFSAHVIEHLSNPNLIWEVARKVLSTNGMIVCFCPNGEPARESLLGLRKYDFMWGKVHPMLITPRYLQSTSARYGYRSGVYSSPYDENDISNSRGESQFTGDELCLIAKGGQGISE